jgi:succinate dehydrogenase / fumarate reductase iron-sulfur subunit
MEGARMITETITFRISRFDPVKDEKPHYQEYSLDVAEGMTVLEALLRIQAEQDGTLAFRYACRGAVCGSCAMVINGREDLACRTQVYGLSAEPLTAYEGPDRKSVQVQVKHPRVITVEPLRNLHVVRDLVVDMDSFFEKDIAIEPWLQPTEPAPERARLVVPEQWTEAEPYTNCILCACCYSVCPVAERDVSYLGPAALGQHYRFLADVRDVADETRMGLTDSEQGVWGCDMVWNCVEICPKSVPPTQGIGKTRAQIRRAKRKK